MIRTLKSPLTIFFIIVFLYFFLINSLAPMFSDDYSYSFVFGHHVIEKIRIRNFNDIFSSLLDHYFQWGGRMVSHFIGMSFLFIGKPVFNLFNSLIFSLFLWLIFYHARGRAPQYTEDIFTLTFIFIMSWFAIPVLGETVFWVIGSVNYLWTTVIIFAFLIPYRGILMDKRLLKDNKVNGYLFFPAGIVAGWTSENTVLTSLIAIISMFLFQYFKVKKVSLPKWFYSGFVGLLTGYLLLVMAPGNFARLSTTPFHYSNMWERITVFISTFIHDSIFRNLVLWIVLLPALFVLFREIKKNSAPLTSDIILGPAYIILGFINYLVMILSPEVPSRTGFASAALIIIGIINIFSNSRENIFTKKRIIYLPLLFITVLSMLNVTLCYINLASEMDLRLQKIAALPAKNTAELKFKPLTVYNDKHVFTKDLTYDPKNWMGIDFSAYYGIKSVALDNSNYKDFFSQSKSLIKNQEYKIAEKIVLTDIRYTRKQNNLIIYFVLKSGLYFSKQNLEKYRMVFRGIIEDPEFITKIKYLLAPEKLKFYIAERYDFNIDNSFKIGNNIIISSKINELNYNFTKIYFDFTKNGRYIGKRMELDNIIFQ
jgi:hypothetical protein